MPNVSDVDVTRVVTRDFSPSDVPAVLSALKEYGTKDWHREVARVRLAILKLADGSVEGLHESIRTADQDYRDVLCYAEYPSYFAKVSPTEKDEARRATIVDADWQQYRQWFEKK